MTKKVPTDMRLKTPMSMTVPIRVREQVEVLARKANVTLSEIGRRALEEYVNKKETAGQSA